VSNQSVQGQLENNFNYKVIALFLLFTVLLKIPQLKGADRKHKQDREKILKRPVTEQEKYQPSYDCTVLTDVS
jgi:hypothetical protein